MRISSVSNNVYYSNNASELKKKNLLKENGFSYIKEADLWTKGNSVKTITGSIVKNISFEALNVLIKGEVRND